MKANEMRKIKLSQGKHCLVDDEDYDTIMKFKWCCNNSGLRAYAVGTIEGKMVLMHRFIMKPKKGEIIDHINGDRLDNRRKNLRICSYSENGQNLHVLRLNTSGLRGVSWSRRDSKWRVSIRANGKNIRLGEFYCKLDALFARKQAERKFWPTYPPNLIEKQYTQ